MPKVVPVGLSGVRALLVDDSAAWLSFVTERLKEVNMDVVGVAFNGLDAVLLVEALQPDLLLLNISLPTRSGFVVARQTRQLSPRTRILFATGIADPAAIREALKAGGHGHVRKSLAGNLLLEAVTAVMAGELFIDPPGIDLSE